MTYEWKEDQPIYRQLRDRMAAAILEGSLKEGDPLPSVRNVAVEYQINPLTASKAYQELANENVVEKRRGIGMYVVPGAAEKLREDEKKHFLEEEWPDIEKRIRALKIDPETLISKMNTSEGSSK